MSLRFRERSTPQSGAWRPNRFTGASREPRQALIVDPYEIGQMGEAVHPALEMQLAEPKARMHNFIPSG